MGYLINPIAFRIGHTREWQDIWFCYKNNYPEFLFFLLKVRFVLNSVFNSYPRASDLDGGKRDKYNLFNLAILYSHFKITFNLHTIFIALFVYPGKYWDSLMDKPDPMRKFSGAFSRSMFWRNVAKDKTQWKCSRKRFRRSQGYRLHEYAPLNSLNRRFNFSKGKYSRWAKQRLYGSKLVKSGKFIYNNRFKIKDKRWLFYNSIVQTFFWDFKKGFHFLLIFFLFFRPFKIFYNLKNMLFKSNSYFFKRFNFSKDFNFYFFKKLNRLNSFHLIRVLSSNFLLYFNSGSFFYKVVYGLKTNFSNYKKFVALNNRFKFFFKGGEPFFFDYSKSLLSYRKIFKIESFNSAYKFKNFTKSNNLKQIHIRMRKFGDILKRKRLIPLYFKNIYNFKTFFPVYLKMNSFHSNFFYFKKFFSLFNSFIINHNRKKFWSVNLFKKVDLFNFPLFNNYLNKLNISVQSKSFFYFTDKDSNIFFWSFYKYLYSKGIHKTDYYKNFYYSLNFFDSFFFKEQYVFGQSLLKYKKLLKRNYMLSSVNFYIKRFEHFGYKLFHILNFFLFFNNLPIYSKIEKNKFNSLFLKKSRLFFFFNYFYRRKHSLLLLFKKHSLYSNFLYNLNNVRRKVFDKNMDSRLLTSKFSLTALYFFLIWLFDFKRNPRDFFKHHLTYDKFDDIEEKDWEGNQIARRFRYRQRKRFRKRRKRLKTFFGRFFKNFLTINWDFIISYLVKKFFFKFNVDIKYFLIFIFFFKSLMKGTLMSPYGDKRLRENVPLERPFEMILQLVSIYRNETDSTYYDFSLEPILYRLMPFDHIKIARYLIDNSLVSALFIANYFAIRLSTGHTPGMLFGPVVRSLSGIGVESGDVKKGNYIDKTTMGRFLSYRLYYFKKFVLKNFLLYKFLMIRFFKIRFTFFNYYLLFYSIYFLFCVPNLFLLIGLVRNFFLRRHVFNFFFNYEFNIFLEKIFSFFSLVLLNFSFNTSIFFDNIFDDLFSNFNLIFFNYDYFNIDLSSVKTANYFFNQIIIYNYWFFNMTWLLNANNLNKLRARLFPMESFKGTIYGFKFHFRGRFSRKQRAGSFIFTRGNVPLTTVAANIDYGFATVPLANSIVSVRVWIFRNPFLKDSYVYNISHLRLVKHPYMTKYFLKQILEKKKKKFFVEKKYFKTKILSHFNKRKNINKKYGYKWYQKYFNRPFRFVKPAMKLSFFYSFYAKVKPLLRKKDYPISLFYNPAHISKNNIHRTKLLSFFRRYIKKRKAASYYWFYKNKYSWKKQLFAEIKNRKKKGIPNYPPYKFILYNVKPKRKLLYPSKLPFLGCYNTVNDVPEYFYPKWYGPKELRNRRNKDSFVYKNTFFTHPILRKRFIGMFDYYNRHFAFLDTFKNKTNSVLPTLISNLNKKK